MDHRRDSGRGKKPLKLGGRFGKPLRVGNNTLTVIRKRSDDFTIEIEKKPEESETAVDAENDLGKNI